MKHSNFCYNRMAIMGTLHNYLHTSMRTKMAGWGISTRGITPKSKVEDQILENVLGLLHYVFIY
jgi:hypothetical protein